MANRRTTRRTFTANSVNAMNGISRGFNFEESRQAQNTANRVASSGRSPSTNRTARAGSFIGRGDRNAYRSLARMDAQRQRTDNYDYTKPSNYSHDARYRNIRRAFGMSAG